jgi:hypothetical protein
LTTGEAVEEVVENEDIGPADAAVAAEARKLETVGIGKSLR